MTPEGKIKKAVKELLKSYGPELWFHMPVLTGYGTPTLDFIGCHRGQFFAVEAKAPGGHVTLRQQMTIDDMREAGAHVMVIDDATGIAGLKAWLDG